MRLSFLSSISALCILSSTMYAQETRSPAAAFSKARALYDTPVDRGLQSFTCDVAFDWKDFLVKATSAPVQDTDERLAYLRSIHLTISDDLNGAGTLHWAAPTTAPDASEDSIAKLRTGFEALWSGFFQSWNGFATGEMVSPPGGNAAIERTTEGFTVIARENGKLAEQRYSRDLRLESLHMVTPSLDSAMTLTFTETAQGLVLASMQSVDRQPPSAAPVQVATTVQYASVNGFQLPSAVTIDVAGTARFAFQLSGCTVGMKDRP